MKKILPFVIFLVTINSGCIYYLLDQTRGQLDTLLHRRPLQEVRTNQKIKKENREKLAMVEEVRQFAREKLNMPSQNYQYYYDTGGKAVAYNVSASFPLKFQPLTWTFPVIGSVPYLGFFDKSQAIALKYSLKKEGLNVVLQEVAAYSTLGWFRDPVFSKMLEEKEYILAEVIIHEITHQHVYAPNQGNFNENTATLVGEEGAKIFLKSRYGENSYFYREYLLLIQDRKVFQKFMLDLHDRLDKLYKGPLSKEEKLSQKEKIIREGKEAFQKLSFGTDRYRGAYVLEWNNAFLLSVVRYRGKQVLLKKLQKEMGDLKTLIGFLKKAAKEKDPWKAVERELKIKNW